MYDVDRLCCVGDMMMGYGVNGVDDMKMNMVPMVSGGLSIGNPFKIIENPDPVDERPHDCGDDDNRQPKSLTPIPQTALQPWLWHF